MIHAFGRIDRSYDVSPRRAEYDRARTALTMPLSYLYHPSKYVFANDDIRSLELDGVSAFEGASHWRIQPS